MATRSKKKTSKLERSRGTKELVRESRAAAPAAKRAATKRAATKRAEPRPARGEGTPAGGGPRTTRDRAREGLGTKTRRAPEVKKGPARRRVR